MPSLFSISTLDYLYFPCDGQAFSGLGDQSVLTYVTTTGFDLLSPSTQTLQFALYHPDDVWSVSDTLTRGGDTVGVIAAQGQIDGVEVAIVDVDTSLATPLNIGDTVTNGTTAQVLSNLETGVDVGGTSTNYWTTLNNGLPAWTPNGDHELIIPNAMAADFFGMSDRAAIDIDMGLVWRQQYRTVGPAQFLLDFGARKSGTGAGGYSYQPNITSNNLRCQFSYSPIGTSTASFLIGTQALDNTSTPEAVFSSYQINNLITRTDMAVVGEETPFGAYFDSASGYQAVDLELPISGSQHGFDLRIFGRSDASGVGYVDALGNGANDYSIRDFIIFFPVDYASQQVKDTAIELAKFPTQTIYELLGQG